MNYDELIAKTPFCTCPIFQTILPNEPLSIYRGKLKYAQANVSGEGDGEIRFDWLPRPAMRFELNLHNATEAQFGFDLETTKLRLANSTAELTANVMHIGENILGYIEPVVIGQLGDAESIKFSLPNFREFRGTPIRNDEGSCWTGRAVMEAEGWRVILDRLNHSRVLTRELTASGGYATTHVGTASRTDGSPVSIENAQKLREDLFWMLSFCRGRWTGPVLVTGHASNGETLWTELSSTKVSSWRPSSIWFHEVDHDGLSRCFPGFLRCRMSPLWREPMTLAIHWFIEANMCAGGIEGGLVLAQAALEMVGWHLLVEDKKICSVQGFKGLPADDKIRLLLSNCGIPLEIPTTMSDLIAECRAFNWDDGPTAITQIRNALAHGQPKQLATELNRSDSVRYDAWCLGLWYLELVLLSLFGYEGKYFNRVKRESWSMKNLDLVPWTVGRA